MDPYQKTLEKRIAMLEEENRRLKNQYDEAHRLLEETRKALEEERKKNRNP